MIMDIVNTRLLSHPLNYFIVWIVLGFALIARAVLHERLASLPDTANS